MVMLIVLPGDDCIGGINTKYLKEYKKMNNNFDTFLIVSETRRVMHCLSILEFN